MSRFITAILELDSDLESQPDSETESKSDTELMAKLKSSSVLNKSFYFQFLCLNI